MIDPISLFGDFPKADPVPRGCGEREPGGVYCESGLSPWGRPLEEFLIDPPLPIPDGLDLINKPQLWQRMLPSGEPALDEQGQPIYDLLIWVGAEFYPYCPDYLEEVRRYGASRRLNPNLDLSNLSRASRMILAHPRAINTLWHEQQPPQQCGKHVPGHAEEEEGEQEQWDEDAWEQEEEEEAPSALVCLPAQTPASLSHTGPCLFKTWELIPIDSAETTITLDGEDRPLCLRTVGSTTYQYRPSGESADGLVPGLFAALPITGFALIRFADGSVNEKAKQKMLEGFEEHGTSCVPFYESDR
jgi:hypothetical protein